MAFMVRHYNTTTTATARRMSSTDSIRPILKSDVLSITPTKSDKPKQPWEGLLMGDPGSDYDQHESRKDVVDYMLNIASETGQYRYMRNWRNQPVFDDTPVEAPAKRKDSCTDVSESSETETEEVVKGKQAAEKKEKLPWGQYNPDFVWPKSDQVKEGRQWGEGNGPAW